MEAPPGGQSPALPLSPSLPGGVDSPAEPQSKPKSSPSPSSKSCSSYKVEQRTILWKQRMDEKMKEVRESRKDRDLEGCTFKPDLVSKHTKPTSGGLLQNSQKSYEKYLKKRKDMMAKKVESEKRAERQPGCGTAQA